MTAKQLAHIAANNARHIAELPKLGELRERLLGIGGDEVVLRLPEPDLETILASGEVWNRERLRMIKMEQSACHDNVIELYLTTRFYRKAEIIRGYGLSDGLWRQHSWLSTATTVIETTLERSIYFGVANRLLRNQLDAALEQLSSSDREALK